MMKLTYLCYEPIRTLDEIARRMKRLRALGYKGIELTACWPPPFSPQDLADLARSEEMPVVSFLTGWSYGNEKLCLCSPTADVRRRAVERLKTYIDYAAPLGALVVVGLMQGLRSDEPDEKAARERIIDCLMQAAEQARAQNVDLVLEPVNHLQVGFHHTAAAAADLVARVGSPAMGYMLDTIHMHIEERSMIATIQEHGRAIRHFHLCESNGARFGSGSINIPDALTALRSAGYERSVSVKVYREPDWEEAARSAAELALPWFPRQ
jgi:sugar phosphate isomerase/epimerase